MDSLPDLITVSPRIEVLLRAFAAQHRENQRSIEQMLVYRRRVGGKSL